MRLKTEEIITSGKILFVFRKKDTLISRLEKIMNSYNFDIFSSSDIPATTHQFNYVFVFNDLACANKLISVTSFQKTKTLILVYNNRKDLERLKNAIGVADRKNCKVINIDIDVTDETIIDNILWFLFSKSPEFALNLERLVKQKKLIRKIPYVFTFSYSKRKSIALAFLCIVCFELFFVLPFIASSYFIAQSARSFKANNIVSAKKNLGRAAPFLSMTNGSYSLARPIFSFFYIALWPDDMILLENKSFTLLQKGIHVTENGASILPLMMNRNKTPLQQQQLINRIGIIKSEISDMTIISTTIAEKISHYHYTWIKTIARSFDDVVTGLNQAQKLMSHIDALIGGTDEKKYVLLFENNMEIRPGGGFIGSYGIITFQNYTIKDINIEDVYNADGQLKAHVEPPFGLKTYMGQPHWFLRDSNFSPDFETNFKQAAFFLDKELGLTDIKGGVALTTTAIADLIGELGNVYLPDYKETITKDNFYIKTQINAESQFFPGSQQKKNFLSDLVTLLIDKITTVPMQKVVLSLKHSLDEKQMTAYVTDTNIQNDLDDMGYGGKLATSNCATRTDTVGIDCINDSVFPVDANIGVNKANFFVSRLITLSININKDGAIQHALKIAFRNESSGSIFPGGMYKNYYQIYMPQNTTIQSVLIDGVNYTDYQESTNTQQFRTVGILVEVPPMQTRDVIVTYTLNTKLKKGASLYQLVVQKQIGAINSDFILQLSLPKNIHTVGQNFTGLAKQAGLVYNTTLSNDRIFLIQLTKE